MLTVQVPAIGSPVAAAHVWELGEFENRINHDKSAGQAAASTSASTCKQRQINSDDVGCGLSTLERLRFFNEFCFGHQVTSGGIIWHHLIFNSCDSCSMMFCDIHFLGHFRMFQDYFRTTYVFDPLELLWTSMFYWILLYHTVPVSQVCEAPVLRSMRIADEASAHVALPVPELSKLSE